jgi:hypothetical protein
VNHQKEEVSVQANQYCGTRGGGQAAARTRASTGPGPRPSTLTLTHKYIGPPAGLLLCIGGSEGGRRHRRRGGAAPPPPPASGACRGAGENSRLRARDRREEGPCTLSYQAAAHAFLAGLMEGWGDRGWGSTV